MQRMKKYMFVLSSFLWSVTAFAQPVPSNPKVIELSLSGPGPGYSPTLAQGSPGIATIQIVNNGSGNPMPAGTVTIDVSTEPDKIPFDIAHSPVYDVSSNGGKWNIVSQSPGFVKLRNTNGSFAVNETAMFELKLLVPGNAPISDALAAVNIGLTPGTGALASNTTATPEDDHMDADIPIVAGTPLPVVLTSFNAIKQGDNCLLQWNTAVEIDNDHFDVERSGNGLAFEKIGTVAGANNSNANKNYTFLDDNTLPDNYYRLKQVDKNGMQTYSNVLQMHFERGESIIAYPNPATDYLTIKGLLGGEQIVVYTTLGQKLMSANGQAGSTTISLQQFAGGRYLVTVIRDGKPVFSGTVVKK
jgi:hypothetical protein